MANDNRCFQTVLNRVGSGFPTRRKSPQLILNFTTILFFTISSLAQQQTPPLSQPDSQSNQQPASPAENTRITVPVGTKLALVLTHPVVSRTVRPGDEIYAQLTDPVAVGNEMAIPAGTYVQGKIDKVVRDGKRGELQMQNAVVLFPNGYTAGIAGPLNLETSEGYVLSDPGKGRIIATFVAPAAGLGLGALIGHAAANPKPTVVNGFTLSNGSTLKSTAIGSIVGLAVGGIASLVMITHSHQFAVDVGAPMEMVLQQPVSFDKARVDDAVREARNHPAIPMQAVAPRPLPPPPAHDWHVLHAGHAWNATNGNPRNTCNRRFAGHAGRSHPWYAVDTGHTISVFDAVAVHHSYNQHRCCELVDKGDLKLTSKNIFAKINICSVDLF